MKNKLSIKLTAGIVVILIISMLTIGLFFIQLFREYVFESSEKTMLARARSIANVMTDFSGSMGSMRGMGGLMRFLDTMTESKVWLTDVDLNPILFQGMGGFHLSQSEPFPPEALDVFNEVLSGKESVSQSFSSVYKEATLTIGVPIFNSNKVVIGTVLLHSPITGITGALDKAIKILLISILIGILLAFCLGIFYSIQITKPLKAMTKVSKAMSSGNYNVRTGVKSNDEIGQLGNSLDLLAEELTEATESINKLERVRKEFVASISHEFRTPLTVIRGSVEAILDNIVTQKVDIDKNHHRILSESKALERLVKDLLDLSRLQSGNFNINIESVDMKQLCEDVVKSMQGIASTKGIEIQFSSSDYIPSLSGDYDRLRQLLVILLDNSIKYSPENKRIDLTLSYTDLINLVIKDNGFGISEEDLPYIWDRYYRADKSNSGSTGLGLAIAKHIIDLHKGSVFVESKQGDGTIVNISLPLLSSKVI